MTDTNDRTRSAGDSAAAADEPAPEAGGPARDPAARDPERIYAMIRSALVELFRLDPARITPEARLADDLEIDSIDAVDLVDQVKRATGRKMSAEDFKSVRTIADLAQVIQRLLRD